MIVQTTNIEQKSINLHDYIMENYQRYFDLSPARSFELAYILGTCNAKSIDLESFKEIFDLQGAGFFDILKFIATASNLERIAAYGSMCLSDSLAQVGSQTVSTGITL